MNFTNSISVTKALRVLGVWFDLPKQLVSDNDPPSTSSEFKQFLVTNGIEHTYSAPYHSSSNGATENAVKTCKNVIKKAISQKLDVDVALLRFLLVYRNTEHCTKGESPAKLLQGRALRMRLDCLKPERADRVHTSQKRQQLASGGLRRNFREGDTIWYRNYGARRKWLEGKIQFKVGNTNYEILGIDGIVHHRHADQLRHAFNVALNDTPIHSEKCRRSSFNPF
ncbi:unnamed protein product [Parnassius mnemosyne]|uniref:Integrase catalytic domain-containing protein n=1 Tax=Parnassius mnemosyne TaxID=213953 RepID=A0AAV1KGX9_9NEOP